MATKTDAMTFDERREHFAKTLLMFGFIPSSHVPAATKRQEILIERLASDVFEAKHVSNRLHATRLIDSHILNTVEASAVIHELLRIQESDSAKEKITPTIDDETIRRFKKTTKDLAYAALNTSQN